MVAAKEKAIRFKSGSSIQPVHNESAHPTATKQPSTVVNRISSCDFTARKFQKPPIGTSEKIHLIVHVGAHTKPRKYTGENVVQLRRLHRAPEMSFYRAYFVPGGIDPDGEKKVCCTFCVRRIFTGIPGTLKCWNENVETKPGEMAGASCRRRAKDGWVDWMFVGVSPWSCVEPPSTVTQGYGRYCGPFRMSTYADCQTLTPTEPPIDDVDLACFYHDCCVATLDQWLDRCHHRTCNTLFCQALATADCSKSPNPISCEWYRIKAMYLTCNTLDGLFPIP